MVKILDVDIAEFKIDPEIDKNIKKHFNTSWYHILGTYCDREADILSDTPIIPKQRAWVKILFRERGELRVERFPIKEYIVHSNGIVDIH